MKVKLFIFIARRSRRGPYTRFDPLNVSWFNSVTALIS